MVIHMKNDCQMLSSILKTTQAGQISIQKVLDTSMRPGLRKALQSQLQEYNAIESDAYALAAQRGWELQEIQPGKRMVAGIMTGMKLSHGNSDSKIADMMSTDEAKAWASTNVPDANAVLSKSNGVYSYNPNYIQTKINKVKANHSK